MTRRSESVNQPGTVERNPQKLPVVEVHTWHFRSCSSIFALFKHQILRTTRMKAVCILSLLLCVFIVECKKQKNSDRKDIIIIDDVKFFKKVMKTHTNLLVLFSQSEVIQTKGKPPCVVLYLEDNLKDIRQFCTSSARNPSVLGIDRTFNLGACFATTLVYQHNNLIRKGASNPPIMLAAIYLHWDGLYTTYHRFFSHLQSKLNVDIGGTQLSKIVIGSDEEAALTKAIKQCFPSSANILCSRHLEENVRRYLTNNIG
ncbi:Hypothetical predicted protein, partial [Paramuricea clavata]